MLRVALMTTIAVALLGLSPASANEIQPLPVGTDADYQLGGPAAAAANVGIVARDRTVRPTPGRYNICYVNGFQTQPNERGFWKKRDQLIAKKNGRRIVDSAWGEFLLDVSTHPKRKQLARIVGAWTRGCAAKGFDAVEYDNLDSFTRSRGAIKRSDAKKFAQMLTRRAHRVGLAVGQKNAAGLNGKRLGFDFAVAEQCGQYRECGRYAKRYGSQVIAIEYTDRGFARACAGYATSFSIVRRDLELKPTGIRRWCPQR